MIGMIGSGKSSWARMAAGTDFNTIRVSGDDIRNMIKDRYTFDFQLEPLVQQMKCALIVQILLAGKNIVIDDCHLTKDARSGLCAMMVGVVPDTKISYVWMQCAKDVALKRRLTDLRGRSEFEWRQVMDKHASMFDTPSVAENDYVSDMIRVVNNE